MKKNILFLMLILLTSYGTQKIKLSELHKSQNENKQSMVGKVRWEPIFLVTSHFRHCYFPLLKIKRTNRYSGKYGL